MKEAVGGTFMIKIFLIFLALYIIFVSVALNYAKAFRVKNKVMDIIEQNEGIDEIELKAGLTSTTGAVGEINTYLKGISYRIADLSDKDKKNRGTCSDELGYCIGKYEYERSDGSISVYYKVTTFVEINLPFFKDFSPRIPITGETRKIERIRS